MTASARRIAEKLGGAGVVADSYAAFENLRSMAFRADLWRLMVLWETGGVYMDAKVKLLARLDHIFDMGSTSVQACVDDVASPAPWGASLYWNGFLAAGPRSRVVEAAIRRSVSNVLNHYYGNGSHELGEIFVTGTGALGVALLESETSLQSKCVWKRGSRLDGLDLFASGNLAATFDGLEQGRMGGGVSTLLWRNGSLYCDEPGPACFGEPYYVPITKSNPSWRWAGGVPLTIVITSGTVNMSRRLAALWESNLAKAPRGTELAYFHSQQVRESVRRISQSLSRAGIVDGAFEAWSVLRPWAFRADLWKYMMLWAHGGVYLDAKMSLTRPLAEWIDFAEGRLTLVKSLDLPAAYYNAVLAAEPGNLQLASTIQHVVAKIKRRSYGHGDAEDNTHFNPGPDAGTHGCKDSAVLAVTGPVALARVLQRTKRLSFPSVSAVMDMARVAGTNTTTNVVKVLNRTVAIADPILHRLGHESGLSYGELWSRHQMYCDEPGPPCD
eukprot:CAMPEP_0117554526 /NCGR_PEP_ID=MMETSP0784-20121206/50800_1 /TAXON_ID=39447 /ORGANISM="" /LENGTH=498 /DNA_ID=CAMNT_0005351695 /DNA_START=137 /DNA_END=1633 /DNA_ORIENTATION=-